MSMPSLAIKRKRVEDVGSGGSSSSSSRNITNTKNQSLCRKCLLSSLLLTSFQQRFIQTVTLDFSHCCDEMDAFLRQIPAKLRQGVVDEYMKVTMGRPVHHQNGACPLSSHTAKRKEFLQTCPFPLGIHHSKNLTDNIVKAYKCHQVCFICGSPRMPSRTRTPTTPTTTHKCTPLTTTSSSIFTTKDAYYTLQLNLAIGISFNLDPSFFTSK